jgi:hypothetical protein
MFCGWKPGFFQLPQTDPTKAMQDAVLLIAAWDSNQPDFGLQTHWLENDG